MNYWKKDYQIQDYLTVTNCCLTMAQDYPADNNFARRNMEDTDRIYLILPLHHVYADMAAFLYTIISGMQIYPGTLYAEACRTDFSEIKPTVWYTGDLQELENRPAAANENLPKYQRYHKCVCKKDSVGRMK